MALQDQLLEVILPHFESSQQRKGDDDYELSLEASATELRTKVSSMQVTAGVELLNLDSDEENEMSEFEEAIGNILISFIDAAVSAESSSDLQDSIDRVLSLIAAFGIPYSTSVANMVISRALEFSEVLLERVRGHACILLGNIAGNLIKLRADKKISNEWIEQQLETIEEALYSRLQDKGQSVRCHALRAAGNFFVSPEDVENYEELLDVALWNMAHDPSVSCRVMAVQSIPVNTKTMDSVIERVRDVKSKVRAEALQVLCKNPQAVPEMTENQFVELIRSGLTKRCGGTKKAASKMICSGWMKSFRYDPIALLKGLGVMDNEEEANQVMDIIMEAARDEDTALLEDLSDAEIRAYKSGIQKAAISLQNEDQPEQVFFLRARCKNVLASKDLTSAQKETITSKLIPDVPLLCELFGNHTKKLVEAIDQNDEDMEDKECFLCLQLLQLAEVADLNEEGSRRHFAHSMKAVLADIETPDDLVEGCINALWLAHNTESDLVNDICDIIEEIDNMRNSINEADDLETIRLMRILSILSVFLETATSELSLNPAVKEFAKYIVPSVTRKNGLVREAAIGCFGKLGLFTNKDTVMSEFKPILLRVASCEEEKIEIRAQSLLALADWSMLFSETLTPCDLGDGGTLSFPNIVRDMMDDSRMSAVCISAEVAAKLLWSGRICSSDWFAKLVTIFFDPRISDMDEDGSDIKEVGSPVRLQQLLTIFFPAICLKEDPTPKDAFMGCILPLCELVYLKEPAKLTTKGKKSRKKVSWPITKMINYICSTVDTGKPDEEEKEKDDETLDARNTTAFVSVAPTVAVELSSTSLLASLGLAEFLAKNLEDNLTDVETRMLSKILGAANFDENEEDFDSVKKLKCFMEDISIILTDEKSLGNIAALNETLSGINADLDNGPSSDGRSPKSGGSLSEDEALDDDNNKATTVGLNLSEDLMKSFDEFKISESDDESGLPLGKENPGGSAKAKRNSGGKSNKARTNSSRRSRQRRLAEAN